MNDLRPDLPPRWAIVLAGALILAVFFGSILWGRWLDSAVWLR